MKTLERLIQKLGVEEIQAKLYAEIYFQGETTVLELSRLTDIKRPTVHFNIEQLIEKGFITEAVRQGRRVLVAKDPSSFVTLVQQRKAEILETENYLGKVISEVASLNSRESNRAVSLLVDEGIDIVKQIYQEALEYGEVSSYFDVEKGRELNTLRNQLFSNIGIRAHLSNFSELFYSREVAVPEHVKNYRNLDMFNFSRTTVKLYGNATNVLVYGKEVVIITKESDWKIMKLTQPVLSMFIKEMIGVQIV